MPRDHIKRRMILSACPQPAIQSRDDPPLLISCSFHHFLLVSISLSLININVNSSTLKKSSRHLEIPRVRQARRADDAKGRELEMALEQLAHIPSRNFALPQCDPIPDRARDYRDLVLTH